MKNMGIGARLLVGFGIVLGLLILTMGVYQVAISTVTGGFNDLLERDVGTNLEAAHAQEAMLQMRRDEKDFLMRNDTAYLKKHEEADKEFAAASAGLRRIAERYNDQQLATKVEKLDEAMAAYDESFDKVVAARGAAGLSATGGNLFAFEQAGRDLEAALPKGRDDLLAEMLQMRRQEKNFRLREDQKSIDGVNSYSASLAKHLRAAGAAKAVAALGKFNAAFSLYVSDTKKANASIEEMRVAVHKVEPILADLQVNAAKKATAQQKATGALATTAGAMALVAGVVALAVGTGAAILLRTSITRALDRVIAGLNAGAEQVTAASNQVAQASQQLASGANEQASSLEETSSSLEEMSSMTRQNTENAKQADAMAREARDSAIKGVEAMRSMNDAIGRIKESSDSTAKIIKTIDEIAFQTNLLALNAAVEAARAGEAGKGFAVVAEEVRNLAQRSAEAAKSTSELIEGSQANADDGVNVATQVGDLLQEISASVDKVTTLASEVSAASEEQSQGIEQVNSAVAQMDRVTQGNAANAEESASASEELSAQARELYDMVVSLETVVRGAHASQIGGNGHAGVAPASGPVFELPHVQLTEAVRQALHRDGEPEGNGDAALVGASVRPETVIPLDDAELKDF